MTVIKLTKSKKAILIITDEGVPYVTSINSVMYLLGGKAKGGFITTKRLPHLINSERFEPSELYDPTGMATDKTLNTDVRNTNDAISVKTQNERVAKKAYTDVDIEL